MRTIWVLSINAFREQLRAKTYYLVILFAGVLIYASLLVGILAVDQKARVLMDLGLAMIELLVLWTTIFGAVTSILKEIESKTLYLILTRPVSKPQYLLGRFAGMLLSGLAAMVVMALIHLSLLWLSGWEWQGIYVLLLAMSYLKVVVMGSVALFFSLFSTSIVASLGTTGILWILGHFLSETKFLLEKSGSLLAPVVNLLLYAVPNMQILNLKDRWEAPGFLTSPADAFIPLGYAVVYSVVCLALASQLFKKKEF